MTRHTAPVLGLLRYAVLLLLLPLAAAGACGGNGVAGPAGMATAAPDIALTPPPTLTPAARPTPPPAPQSTAVPANRPPTPTPSPPTPAPTPNPARETTPKVIPYVQLSAGKYHACGRRADGVVHCWGSNAYGESYVPARTLFRQISAGLNFTCGLRYDGVIVCWGRNSKGQTAAPAGAFTRIDAGRTHACALDAAGAAVCWGGIAEVPAPDAVFTSIGSGLGYSCGLTAAGDLQCWGGAPVESLNGPFQALAAGLNHICVLNPDGVALCYGANENYQSNPPATAFTHIAAGWRHSCGITRRDSTLECWGAQLSGQPDQRLSAPAGTFTALSVGWFNNCALQPDGAARCWRQFNPEPSIRPSANLTEAFDGRVFDFPVELLPWPAGGLAVVERRGEIRAYDPSGANPPRPILDLSDRIDTFATRGMLTAALDPDFDQFPFLYVYYHLADPDNRQQDDPQVVGRLSRFPVVDGAALPDAELVLLTLHDLNLFHHGGAIRFGPDGMLYLGFGDNDDPDVAQDLTSRHGKIIRIAVRGATAEQPYRIPDDNPFVRLPDARPEIWAYGLRNPWRMDFDAAGNLWVADVGSSRHEEVSIATAGANLGWPAFEGNLCRWAVEDCAGLAAATAPVITYTHQDTCAIIGGVAPPQPEIAYIFGDYCNLVIWALEGDPDTGWLMREIARASGNILGFGRGAAGEVYVLIRNKPILRLEW